MQGTKSVLTSALARPHHLFVIVEALGNITLFQGELVLASVRNIGWKSNQRFSEIAVIWSEASISVKTGLLSFLPHSY